MRLLVVAMVLVSLCGNFQTLKSQEQDASSAETKKAESKTPVAVSYTHLTLPTIYSV